ncbi:Slp family lipoprotein [Dyella caseinilytica]|uniref:Slp family lipoprotein n=1 Tax=Dyella caseinilytica TaxID=1849581 RepID=A0ABX7GQ35_9GAMM|nr:Slp family lipoprotein [Dyella caseinilytica]QRN52537.1 Slp family lipoprotein [Dyella caseinilytica]
MNIRSVFRPLRWLAVPVALALTACAPAPIYQVTPGTVNVIPMQVAHSPEQFAKGDVIWGGSVIDVRNFPDHTEVEMLAYPLDSSQRPQTNAQAQGRYIAIYTGYVEALNFPPGGLVTISGQLNGSRSDSVDQATYVYPLVNVTQSHRWTAAELRAGHPDIHFGVGVGVGIH